MLRFISAITREVMTEVIDLFLSRIKQQEGENDGTNI